MVCLLTPCMCISLSYLPLVQYLQSCPEIQETQWLQGNPSHPLYQQVQ